MSIGFSTRVVLFLFRFVVVFVVVVIVLVVLVVFKEESWNKYFNMFLGNVLVHCENTDILNVVFL